MCADVAHDHGMHRSAALALSIALAASPACAHGQLTNQQVALGAVGVAVVVGAMIVTGMAIDCERTGPCPKPQAP